MTNPITEPRYTFSTAALASGVPPKTIRNWFDRKELILRADEFREGSKWRRFSVWDITHIALTKPFVDYCIPVSAASIRVGGILSSCMMLLSYKNTPPSALVAGLNGTVHYAWKEPNGSWAGYTLRPGEELHPSLNPPPSVIIMDVGRIVERVVSTLEEIDAAEQGEEQED